MRKSRRSESTGDTTIWRSRTEHHYITLIRTTRGADDKGERMHRPIMEERSQETTHIGIGVTNIITATTNNSRRRPQIRNNSFPHVIILRKEQASDSKRASEPLEEERGGRRRRRANEELRGERGRRRDEEERIYPHPYPFFSYSSASKLLTLIIPEKVLMFSFRSSSGLLIHVASILLPPVRNA